MSKRPYFTMKSLEKAVHGDPKAAPEDMVRPIFEPLTDRQSSANDVFYEDEKMLVLNAPVCDSQKLIDALTHEPCEAEVYLSKLLERDGDPMLIVSLDTEYEEIIPVVEVDADEENEDGPVIDIYNDKKKDKKKAKKNTNIRKILSYQVSCYYQDQIVRLIFFSKTTELLSTEDILSVVLNYFRVKANRNSIKDDMKNIDIAILAYNALADITTLKDFPLMANTFAKSVDLLSRESYKLKIRKNKAYDYLCDITVVGVQNHVPGGLKELGEGMQLPKIELPTGIIKQMCKYRNDNFDKFLEYGINDSDICLLWYLLNFKDMYIPISAPALGAKIIEDAIAGECESKEEQRKKVLEWRGLVTKKRLTTDKWHNRPSYMKVGEEAVSELAEKIFLEASNAYAGGMNQCMIPGFYDVKTYDYDLCGCYPTAGSLLRDPDYNAEISLDMIYKREITMDYVEKYDFLTYGFGTVKFEFPEDTTFPCIAQSDENRGLIFTRTSEDYISTTWPEVRMAILMGARVYAGEFYFYASKKDDEGNDIYTLRKAYKKMTEFRALAKLVYATEKLPKPIQELVWKLAANGAYGKLAQNVAAKKSRDVRYDKTVELGPSSITSPAHASYITALPRVLLCAVMEQLTKSGYKCYSVTTDGFITDAPLEELNSCDGFGLVELFSQSRKYLVDDSKVWECKHKQNYLLNITTRANQGFNDMESGVVIKNETVNAHVGFKIPKDRTDEEKELLPDEALFTYEYLNHYEKGVPTISLQLPNLNDVVRRNTDYVGTNVTCDLKFNYDFKRLPDYDRMGETDMPFRGQNYKVLNYPTKPYEDFKEYEKFRDTKNKSLVIRDWKSHIEVKGLTYEDSLKIPSLDAQMRAAISHIRLIPEHRIILDKVIKYRSLEYVLAVISGTVRKSLDAYIKKHSDEELIKGIDTYEAKFLTINNWANFGKKQRFNIHNYMGYAIWVENAVMFRLRNILHDIEKIQ